MRGNVKTIKLTAWLSFLFAVIAYFITIKDSLGLCELKWLPDIFLLAIFGGAFASMLVVLICEISKYFQNREATETYLVSHLFYLYGQLLAVSKNIGFFIDQKKDIPDNGLSQFISTAEAELNAVFFADYAPIRKSNGVLVAKQDFNKKVFPVIQSLLQSCRMLVIAVTTDKIDRIKTDMGIDCDAANNASAVLMKLSDQIREPLSLVDELLTRMDQLCRSRYDWPRVRDDLVKGMPDYQANMLEQFLKK